MHIMNTIRQEQSFQYWSTSLKSMHALYQTPCLETYRMSCQKGILKCTNHPAISLLMVIREVVLLLWQAQDVTICLCCVLSCLYLSLVSCFVLMSWSVCVVFCLVFFCLWFPVLFWIVFLLVSCLILLRVFAFPSLVSLVCLIVPHCVHLLPLCFCLPCPAVSCPVITLLCI